MIKTFIKQHRLILLLNAIVLLCFILGYGRYGDVVFDSFREMYIPEQMIKGHLLYKNIFSIYAPFAYIFNAVLLKIFGVNLKVLYFAGLAGTLGIVNLVFLISNIFLEKKYSFAITLFFISSSVLSANVFNCIFPYSYGMLYGLLFVLLSLYFMLKERYEASLAMYSFAVCSKYEFILLLPLLVYAGWKKKNWKYILSFILPFAVTYAPLFIQGISPKDLIVSCRIIFEMSAAKTLYWFYSVTGLVLRPELIPVYIANAFKIAIPVSAMYFINSYFLLPVIFVYCYFILTPELMVYIFPLILILFVIRFRLLSGREKLFITASLLVSMKIFFALILQSYGIYFVPFALISVFILSPVKLRKALLITVLMCAFTLSIKNTSTLISKNTKIKTPNGLVYALPETGESVKSLIEYIDTNTKKDDKVVVYPECLSVNVLGERNSDNKFYSLIPLYVETFSEPVIIKRLEITKPEYIIIGNIDTSSYYYSYFGIDYAGSVFDYILKNYEKQTLVGKKTMFAVFRRKSGADN